MRARRGTGAQRPASVVRWIRPGLGGSHSTASTTTARRRRPRRRAAGSVRRRSARSVTSCGRRISSSASDGAARRRRRGGTRCRRRSRTARGPSPALDGEVEEVRRARDARVVVADRLLAQCGERGVVEMQVGRRRPRRRSSSIAAWFCEVGGTIVAERITPAGVELVAVVEQRRAAPRSTPWPDAGARRHVDRTAARGARRRR